MFMETENTNAQVVLDAGRALATPLEVDRSVTGESEIVVVPQDYKLESLERFQMRPDRIRADMKFTEVESFTRYVKSMKGENTQIFAELTPVNFKLVAVLDFHTAETPSWNGHKAHFVGQVSPEWDIWTKNEKKPMSQEGFAQFLEANQLLFVQPTGAELLELVTTLEGKADVRIDSKVRLQNGSVGFNYVESVTLAGQVGEQKGQMVLPERLVAGIAPFLGFQSYKVEAFLRYRIAERKLQFWYETINPHLIMRDLQMAVLAAVEKETGIKPLVGILG
jgi:uncharacterized protein YfdQ (DUF2303 family)